MIALLRLPNAWASTLDRRTYEVAPVPRKSRDSRLRPRSMRWLQALMAGTAMHIAALRPERAGVKPEETCRR